jgi:hypothetical protein
LHYITRIIVFNYACDKENNMLLITSPNSVGV